MLQKPILFLIRHGATTWSKAGRHTSLSDIPLTAPGKKEVLLLKKRLHPIKFAHSFTSPLKRAYDTSCLCGFKATVDHDLVEWNYGDYEGLTSTQIHRKQPKWSLFEQGCPGGEAPQEISARADRFLKKLTSLKGNIVIFSSGHILRALATRFLRLPISKGACFSLQTASLSILGYEHRSPAILLWNDISHLS